MRCDRCTSNVKWDGCASVCLSEDGCQCAPIGTGFPITVDMGLAYYSASATVGQDRAESPIGGGTTPMPIRFDWYSSAC